MYEEEEVEEKPPTPPPMPPPIGTGRLRWAGVGVGAAKPFMDGWCECIPIPPIGGRDAAIGIMPMPTPMPEDGRCCCGCWP